MTEEPFSRTQWGGKSQWLGLKRSLTLPPSPHCLGNLVPVSAPQDKHCEHASLSFKPSSLYSPTTILKYQRGNCFDFAVLLCSLLIGAGYDAYCVHGYATLEMCSLDQTQELCPLLRKPPEVRPAVSGQGGAQHTCSACSSPLSSRAELGGTASGPYWVSVCTRDLTKGIFCEIFYSSLQGFFGFTKFLLTGAILQTAKYGELGATCTFTSFS